MTNLDFPDWDLMSDPQECDKCDGEGWIFFHESDSYSEDPYYCHGDVRFKMDCDRCDGKGAIGDDF